MKFNINDRVKIVKISSTDPSWLLNQIGEVIKIRKDREFPYEIKFVDKNMQNNVEQVLWQEHELDYDKPCDYCTENKSLYFDSKYNNPNLHEVYIEDDGNMTIVPYLCNATESVQIKINYCPMCGKELVLN